MLFESVLFGFSVFILIKCLQIAMKRRKMQKVISSMPGPSGWPIIGIALEAFGGKNVLEYVTKLTEFYGTAKFWFGPLNLMVVTESPDDIKLILNSENCIDKSPFYDYLGFDNGLFVAKKETWSVHRKILTPAFNKNMLKSYMEVFTKKSKELVKSLISKIGKPEFDILDGLTIFALDTIYETMLGINTHPKDNLLMKKYIQESQRMNEIAMERITTSYFHINLIYFMSKLYKEERKLKKSINEFFENILDIIKREAASNINNNNGETSDNSKQERFIDLLLKNENKFSAGDIRNHIKAISYGGFDTSSLTIATVLLMLAMHKDVQDKAVEEIGKTFDSIEQLADLKAINKLSYLEMVVKETMRLFPVGGFIARYTTGTVNLESHKVPPGAILGLNIMKLHRNPNVWGEDAHLFYPERFDPENFKHIHPYAFLPFTNGHRICLAHKYAMIFTKTVLTDILRHYQISTTLKYEEIETNLLITLKVEQGYKISLKKRN